MTRYEVELTDEEARAIEEARPVGKMVAYDTPWWTGIHALADAIRANPPKPPRMTEPGWGEKVIAHTDGPAPRRPFVRWSRLTEQRWASTSGAWYAWSDLIDPEPVDGAR